MVQAELMPSSGAGDRTAPVAFFFNMLIKFPSVSSVLDIFIVEEYWAFSNAFIH